MTVLRTWFSTLFSLVGILFFLGCITAPVKDAGPREASQKIAFQSLTISESDFLRGVSAGAPTAISGQLHIPAKQGKLPAVILTHGSGGVGGTELGWAKELNRMGFAAFIVDSFTDRGLSSTSTGDQTLSTGSAVIDVYRGLELLRTHPRIDPSRICLM